LPASAQSTASASLGNLSIQLIDLAPGDGINPSLTFTGNTSAFASATIYLDPAFTNVAVDDSLFGIDNITVHAGNASGDADAFASALSVSAGSAIRAFRWRKAPAISSCRRTPAPFSPSRPT
jgi:hypothetical protein